MLNPDVIADGKNEAIKLPTIPDHYILMIGDLSKPEHWRWYHKSNLEDSQAAQTKRDEFWTVENRSVPDQDKNTLFYELIPATDRAQYIAKIKSGEQKILSYSRFQQNQSAGENLNQPIEQVAEAAKVSLAELGI